MAATKITYGTSTDLVMTSAATLASSTTAGCASAAVDNTTTRFDDSMLYLAFAIANDGSVGNDLCAYVYAYGSEDGTNYSDGRSGSDEAVTTINAGNMHFLGTVAIPAINATYKKVFPSVALAFGGVLPRKWGIYVRNYSGHAFASEVSSFTGITETIE